MRAMSSVKVALAAALALLTVALVLVLLHSPMSVARTNGTPGEEEIIALARRGATFCQAGELVPRGTAAIRLSLSAFTGPRVTVAVSAGGRMVTTGQRGSGWTSRVVTVPVRPLPRPVAGATVCVSFPLRDEVLTVFGKATPASLAAREDGRPSPGRLWIEYLHAGGRSWASLLPSVVRHFGFGRAAPGTWIALLALALLVAVAALSVRLAVKELT
jgi:hypothetical protein